MPHSLYPGKKASPAFLAVLQAVDCLSPYTLGSLMSWITGYIPFVLLLVKHSVLWYLVNSPYVYNILDTMSLCIHCAKSCFSHLLWHFVFCLLLFMLVWTFFSILFLFVLAHDFLFPILIFFKVCLLKFLHSVYVRWLTVHVASFFLLNDFEFQSELNL